MDVYDADYWQTDDWNMDKAVDNNKFKDLYGFDYQKENYDQYLEEEIAYEEEVTEDAGDNSTPATEELPL